MSSFLFEPFFEYLTDETGFSIDQIRYIVLLFACYPLALILRYLLHPSHTPLILRYGFSFVFGLLLALICFGWKQVGILFTIIMISFFLLIFLPPTVVQRYSMIWAFVSISATHIYRIITDYGGYHLDFTGPMMVLVQRITYVAYALHDGQARQLSELNKDQIKQKIDSPPSVLIYLSYMFNFHTFFAGPTCTFREYQAFIDGSNLHLHNSSTADNGKKQGEPSMWYPVLTKMAGSLLSLYLFVNLDGYINNSVILDPQYSQPYRLLLISMNSFRLRTRYYFIWLLAESINNCAGLGFSGYDKQGRPQWNLMSNLTILDIEFGSNLRISINGWNALTSLWLRRCVYERAVVTPTLLTFVLSAFWHGFYPGYYFCFVYFGIALEAARKMRRLLRPYFQRNRAFKAFYFVITMITTIIFREYGVTCLDLMFLDQAMLFWSYYYYIPFITVCVVACVPLPGQKKATGTNTIVSMETTATAPMKTDTKEKEF